MISGFLEPFFPFLIIREPLARGLQLPARSLV